jgi:hypothetical protein
MAEAAARFAAAGAITTSNHQRHDEQRGDVDDLEERVDAPHIRKPEPGLVLFTLSLKRRKVSFCTNL